MAPEHQNEMQCSEFDALLSEALDQILSGPKFEAFQAHAKSCAVCGPLLAEAEVGKRWLEQLVEVDAPQHMVHNILAATTGIDTARMHAMAPAVQISWYDRIAEWANAALRPLVAVVKQPRFAMSFGMAFFSLSISLSLAGVKLSDVRHADLRPSAIKRNYYETKGRVVKYYENIRVVYEMESRLREFKRATTPAEPETKKDSHPKNDDRSEHPDEKEQRNYSQGDSSVILASLSDNPPVVNLALESWTTLRRIV